MAESESPDMQKYLECVRKYSPYYGKLWEHIPPDRACPLHEYPVVDHSAYWQANQVSDNQVLTSHHTDGIIMRTGGTTSGPKYTFLSKEELRTAAYQLGLGIIAAGIRPYDHVANLFYAGELYGGFLLHILSNMQLGVPVVQIPIAGLGDPAVTCRQLKDLQANVILATPTTMVMLAEYLNGCGQSLAGIRVLMFSGEFFHEDQRATLSRAFPTATIRSLMYGSIDAGALGYSASDSETNLYTVTRPFVALEIVPEGSTSPTTCTGVPGSLLVTNMGRTLQPVVRYPSGDRAEWVDYDKGLFRVLGRTQVGVRIGPVSIDLVQLQQVVRAALPGIVQAMQAVITREGAKDTLSLRLVCQLGQDSFADRGTTRETIAEAVDRAYPMFAEHVNKGFINPLVVEQVLMSSLVVNQATGKVALVVDKRHES